MSTSPRIKPEILICLFLVVATGVVYWQVKDFSFVNYDDDVYITNNRHVTDGLTSESILWALTTGHAHNWHPLTWLSHMLDCQLFGLNPAGHHLSNLLLHIMNSILLFWVFRSMTGNVWRSGFIAAIFALHPLHVEPVAWVAERKAVLSTLFWMLTIGSYARYAARPSVSRYLLALLFFALGLMAKPMLVTLPFVLMLLDYWPLGRISSAGSRRQPEDAQRGSHLLPLLWEKVPFLAVAAASSTVTFIVQLSGGAVRSLEEWPLGMRIGNALVSYTLYMGKVFLPRHLAIPYPHPGALPFAQIALACTLLVFISVFVLRVKEWRPYLAVGWFWFLGTLVPVIGLVQVGAQAMADRYSYVPSIGIFVMVAWDVPAIASRWRLGRRFLATAAALVLVILMIQARAQVHYWRNSIALFEHALAVTDGNYIAHNNLGMAVAEEGRADEAIQHYFMARDINPSFPKTHFNLGAALFQKGEAREAIGHYSAALNLDPDWQQAHYNLGIALAAVGRLDDAVRHYSEAVRIDPRDTKSLNNLANLFVRQGEMDQAIRMYSEASEVDPTDAAIRNNLGAALASQRRFTEAIAQFRAALELEPDDLHASTNLERALADQAMSE